MSDWHLTGSRDYELTNHLGNVLAVITDKKIGVSSGGSVVDYYKAEVLSQQDYYPFGMMEPERQSTVLQEKSEMYSQRIRFPLEQTGILTIMIQ